jgi:KipI family sensor histidine kinase inhibitor
MRVLPMGPRSVLVEEIGDPAAWAARFRRLAIPEVYDVVPAATTVLVVCADSASMARVRTRLEDVGPGDAGSVGDGAVIEITVRYDGDDLELVAAATGLDVDDVVAAHTAPTYVVGFCGFSPGFGYLRGLDERLHVPRRATPRTRVPAGSVAIAAEYTAVYPRPSPGGWHLLGTTEELMFDPDRSPPALFEPGARVRFVAA